MVLLHGLLATGDVFSEHYESLAVDHRVIVPDLLGFGRSLDEDRSDFSADQHLDALDHALDQLGVGDRPVVLGAHSMGAAIAVRWAARRTADVQRIICWGPPIYPAQSRIQDVLADTGPLARLFATDTAWARHLCAWSCNHREPAGWIATFLTPELPIPIARSSSLHTWHAYRSAMDDLVMATDWTDLITRLAGLGIEVRLVWGTNDPVGDRDYAGSLAQDLDSVHIDLIAGADHHLPLTHPDACIEQLKAIGPTRSP